MQLVFLLLIHRINTTIHWIVQSVSLILIRWIAIYQAPVVQTLYTCQLSRLRRESHACGLKTSISRLLTPAGQFLTPDWKMWVVAVLLDTISKNTLPQTHVRKKTMCKMNKWQYLPRDLWFLKWKALGASSPLADFGRLRKNLRKWSCRLQKSQHSQDKNLTLISQKKLAGIICSA